MAQTRHIFEQTISTSTYKQRWSKNLSVNCGNYKTCNHLSKSRISTTLTTHYHFLFHIPRPLKLSFNVLQIYNLLELTLAKPWPLGPCDEICANFLPERLQVILNLANCNPLRSALIQSSIWRNFFCHWRAVICESKTRSVVPVRLRAQGLASKKRKENHQSSLILTYKRGKMTSEPRSVDSQFSSETKSPALEMCAATSISLYKMHVYITYCLCVFPTQTRVGGVLRSSYLGSSLLSIPTSLHFHKFRSIC